jgi:Secretion system C-terminal sorting domain
MFKHIFILCAMILVAAPSFAQATLCVPNDTVTTIVYPAPEINGTGGIKKIACKGTPFNFTWTFNIPPTINVNGISANLDSVNVATTGAVLNLPANLNYSCNPPNCVFKANQKGCIGIKGNLSSTIPASDIELSIAVMINAKLFGAPLSIPFNIPDPALTGAGKYILRVREPNDPLCTVGVDDQEAVLSSLQMSPVPALDYVQITLEAPTAGAYQIHVLDSKGQEVYANNLALTTGINQTELDVTQYPAGAYQLMISRGGSFIAKSFVVTK